MNHNKKIIYADDDTESVGLLMRLRAPGLVLGLLLGIMISFLTSRFEEVLTQNIRTAFFLPFIVYMADAIGTQTQAIYSGDLKSGSASFHNYLIKESLIGVFFGIIFAVISGTFILWWLEDELLALSVAVSIVIAVASAPVIALITSGVSAYYHQDPAAEAGPIATVIQDMISVVIYGTVCSVIML